MKLSDDFHQDEPLAYLVKCYFTGLHEYKVFADGREADSFAAIQTQEASDNGEPSDFLIYPLYAGVPITLTGAKRK